MLCIFLKAVYSPNPVYKSTDERGTNKLCSIHVIQSFKWVEARVNERFHIVSYI